MADKITEAISEAPVCNDAINYTATAKENLENCSHNIVNSRDNEKLGPDASEIFRQIFYMYIKQRRHFEISVLFMLSAKNTIYSSAFLL